MPLGARTTQVVCTVLSQGMRTIGIAIVLGLPGAYVATLLIESQLYEVPRADPLTFIAPPLMLGVVAPSPPGSPSVRSIVNPVVVLRAQ